MYHYICHFHTHFRIWYLDRQVNSNVLFIHKKTTLNTFMIHIYRNLCRDKQNHITEWHIWLLPWKPKYKTGNKRSMKITDYIKRITTKKKTWQYDIRRYMMSREHNVLMELTLDVRGTSYPGLTRSISWLLMPWLLTSPGHQQPWYWLCRTGRFLSYLRKEFNYLGRINVEKWHKT